jgi:hypothetical protein
MIRTANHAAESKDPVLDSATTGLDRNSHCAFLQFVVAQLKKATMKLVTSST